MALALSTLRGTPTYGKDASTGNQWLSSGVLAPPSATAFDLPSGGTISIRVRTTSTGTIVACGSDNGQSPGGFWLGIQNGLAAVAPGNGIGGVIIASTAAINDGAWHTLTLNVTSTGIEFLVDGSRATFKDGTPNPFTGVHAPFVWGKGTVAIGGLGAYTQFDWAGDIDAFSVVDSTGATIFATEFSEAVIAPVAVTASSSQTVAAGSSVSLNATAAGGSGSYTYSWAQTAGTSVSLSSPTAKSPTFTAPAAAASLAFTVTATDSSGASATASTSVSVSAPPADTTAPTAPTVAAKGATTSSVTVSVSGGTDAVGVTQYRAMVAGGSWQTRTGAGDITLSGLSAGTSYTVSAQAGDAAGNWSPSATVSTATAAASTGGGATSPPATSGDTSVSPPAGPAEAFVQFKHLSGASKITVVTMTGSATYDPATLGATPTQAASVMFVQPASGGATATVNGAALNLNTAPNARTLVQLVPTANGYAPLYPTTTLVAPYGARPPLAPGCVRYKGATQPTDWLTNDTWEQTA